MVNNPAKISVIVNPLSGRGRGLKKAEEIKQFLKANNIQAEFYETRYSKHAVVIGSQCSERGDDLLAVIGGDGTVHEAANGLLQNSNNRTAITVLPVGTGNDFAFAYKIDADIKKFTTRLIERNYFEQDVMQLNYPDGKVHYCISLCGIGFDATVAKSANEKKKNGKRGKNIYINSALKTVFSFKPQHVQLDYEGKTQALKILTMALGIHRTNGGGLIQCPHAQKDDNLISVTVIKPINILNLIPIVTKLFIGNITTHSRVLSFNTHQIHISADNILFVETDGEDAGQLPIDFKIIPKALKVLC